MPAMTRTGSPTRSPCRVRNISIFSRTPSGSAGSPEPLPYPAGRYVARTRDPSGAIHQNAGPVTEDGTPRHTTASSKPNWVRIWGIWAMWPNMSGR